MKPLFTPHFASTLRAGGLCAALVAAPFAWAEDAPPSYEASPNVYKLVVENAHFRVIEATWKPDQKDLRRL